MEQLAHNTQAMFELPSDPANARGIRNLITAIVQAGRYEWVPFPTHRDGETFTALALVGPGIPMVVNAGDIDYDAAVGRLMRKYMVPLMDDTGFKRFAAAELDIDDD